MKIDDMEVKSVTTTDKKTVDNNTVTHTTAFANKDNKVKVTIVSNEPSGFIEGSDSLTVEIKNTQKTLSLETPEPKPDIEPPVTKVDTE